MKHGEKVIAAKVIPQASIREGMIDIPGYVQEKSLLDK
jgi:hypothetical protein